MTAVVGLLAFHLAAGTLAVAALLALRHRLPPGFLRFCAMASALVGLAACFLGPGLPERWIVATAGLLWYASLRSGRTMDKEEKPRHNVAAGLVFASTLVAWALDFTFGAATSAFLLGAVTVSMVLGHWYLVDPKLAIAPLKLGAFLFALAVVVRGLDVGWTFLYRGQAALGIERGADLIYSTPALFFVFRATTGLGGPLLLAGLIWQTVRMRSTQSATGLLYVAVILVLFGELIAHFLTVTSGGAL